MEVKDIFITIVGCGPGSPDYIAPAARRAVEQANVLVGARRLLDLFPGCAAEKIEAGADIEDVLCEIEVRRHRGGVVVLVTGDPGLCSLAKPVIARFGRRACRIIPGISSIQTAFARIGLDWLGARIIDAHGENPPGDFSGLEKEDKIAVLAGRDESFRWISMLADRAGSGRRIFLCEDLTLPGETVCEINASDLDSCSASPRTVVLLVREELLA